MADQVFYIRKLEAYRAHLRTRRNDVGRSFTKKTLSGREAGAEDFALFLLNLEPVSSDRPRGALVGERVKPLTRRRAQSN